VFHEHTLFWIVLTVALFALGTAAARNVAAKRGHPDPRSVVVDELVGMMASLTAFEWSWGTVLGAFLAFRFFDVVKPFPARMLEHVPNGFGIMLDDIVAAVYASVAVRLALVLIPH
jgi:phosphatidylglycerophosphatase A